MWQRWAKTIYGFCLIICAQLEFHEFILAVVELQMLDVEVDHNLLEEDETLPIDVITAKELLVWLKFKAHGFKAFKYIMLLRHFDEVIEVIILG